MRAAAKKKIAMVFAAGSVLFLTLTFVLPDVKFPQTEEQVVVGTPNAAGSYDLRWFDIPPVDANVKVHVTLGGYAPRSVEFALFPLQGDRTLAPLYYGDVDDTATLSFTSTQNETRPLRLMIVSFNGTGYTVQVSSVWSPYYVLRVYSAPALFVSVTSLVTVYYYREAEIKEEAIAKALAPEGQTGTQVCRL